MAWLCESEANHYGTNTLDFKDVRCDKIETDIIILCLKCETRRALYFRHHSADVFPVNDRAVFYLSKAIQHYTKRFWPRNFGGLRTVRDRSALRHRISHNERMLSTTNGQECN